MWYQLCLVQIASRKQFWDEAHIDCMQGAPQQKVTVCHGSYPQPAKVCRTEQPSLRHHSCFWLLFGLGLVQRAPHLPAEALLRDCHVYSSHNVASISGCFVEFFFVHCLTGALSEAYIICKRVFGRASGNSSEVGSLSQTPVQVEHRPGGAKRS